MHRRTVVLVITVIMGLIGISLVTAAVTGQIRYVVASNTAGIEFKQYPLWANKGAADGCSKARSWGTKKDQEELCETSVRGWKPKVGPITVGTIVELLDSRACGEMAYIRVLTENFKGETGCIAADALSSVQP
jgi:hypothetical protein